MNLAAIPSEELARRLELAHEGADALSDHAAEIEGEIARFGDSGPGTAKILAAYRAACRDVREISAELARRNPVAPACVGNDEDVPF